LLDKDFRPVKSEEIGELFVSGLNLAQGYVNGRDPDKFIENPLAVDPRKFF
jgi:non-ribosomal peptide synthetase component F